MIDWNKPLSLINDDKFEFVKVLTTTLKSDFPVIAVIKNKETCDEEVMRLDHRGCTPYAKQAVKNVPEKVSGWMNIYTYNGGLAYSYTSSPIYNTKELADKFAISQRVACIEVEFFTK